MTRTFCPRVTALPFTCHRHTCNVPSLCVANCAGDVVVDIHGVSGEFYA